MHLGRHVSRTRGSADIWVLGFLDILKFSDFCGFLRMSMDFYGNPLIGAHIRGYLDLWISSHYDLDLWIPGPLDTLVDFRSWTFGYLDLWIPGPLDFYGNPMICEQYPWISATRVHSFGFSDSDGGFGQGAE